MQANNTKIFIAFVGMTTLFFSCDVRRKDKVVDDNVRQMEMALKDSTEVQGIDTTYNFGNIKEGEKVAFSFRFKNIGKKPLVITDAFASCGCTVPEKPERPVLPGEIGLLKVVFSSKGKAGHQEKAITVQSNASPTFPALKLVGEVDNSVK